MRLTRPVSRHSQRVSPAPGITNSIVAQKNSRTWIIWSFMCIHTCKGSPIVHFSNSLFCLPFCSIINANSTSVWNALQENVCCVLLLAFQIWDCDSGYEYKFCITLDMQTYSLCKTGSESVGHVGTAHNAPSLKKKRSHKHGNNTPLHECPRYRWFPCTCSA